MEKEGALPPRKPKYEWMEQIDAREEAQALRDRRWVGCARKQFRILASPYVNMKVRQTAHEIGLRYILNDERLPGSPHLVFPARKLAIFTVDAEPGLFRGGPPNPSSRSREERRAWELMTVQKALTDRGWRSELITAADTRIKRSLVKKLKRILSEEKAG
jgi:DNA mismatch endonuclease (patch repair protein)